VTTLWHAEGDIHLIEIDYGQSFPFDYVPIRDVRTPFSPQWGEGSGMRGISTI